MRGRAALLLLALVQAVPRVQPEPKHFRYERAVEITPGTAGRVCAALDAAVFAHSNSLTDVRLYAGGEEVPYALSTSQAQPGSDAAEVLNLGKRAGHIVFDLQMPSRPYSTVELQLAGENFLATAKVTGSNNLAKAEQGTSLGTFTLFDLTAQRLGRSTSLDLAESSFAYLHIELDAKAAPGHLGFVANPDLVGSAQVPPSREAQTLYTPVAETTAMVQADRSSVASFALAARVPVERVSFALRPGDRTNFSRAVRITAKAAALPNPDAPPPLEEKLYGEISRVRILEGGTEIRRESLDVPATLGSNSQTGAKVEVAVENGDDKPLALAAVRLEMRERKLCFDAPGRPVTMFYGDDKLQPPVYDYSRLFVTTDAARPATLAPEQANPQFEPRVVDRKKLIDRHPEILWLALLGVVAALGFVAFRSAKRV